MEYTDKELDDINGTSSRQFTKYRVLSIDNGEDLMGTNATGNFIEKSYDEESKKVERKKFAKEFPGVIISARSQVVDKAKFPSWKTEEFNPSDKSLEIAVYLLMGGKFIKNPAGNFSKSYMTYDELKKKRQVTNPDGTKTSTYTYYIILYVGVDGEVVKLKFKGTGRGNYFDYNKSIAYMKAQIYNVITIFSTYIDKTTGKYTIKFDIARDEKGMPLAVDTEEVRKMRVELAENFSLFSKKQLSAPAQVKKIDNRQGTIDNLPVMEEEEIPLPEENEEIPWTNGPEN